MSDPIGVAEACAVLAGVPTKTEIHLPARAHRSRDTRNPSSQRWVIYCEFCGEIAYVNGDTPEQNEARQARYRQGCKLVPLFPRAVEGGGE